MLQSSDNLAHLVVKYLVAEVLDLGLHLALLDAEGGLLLLNVLHLLPHAGIIEGGRHLRDKCYFSDVS